MENFGSLFDREFMQNPYPRYAALRDAEPVQCTVTPDGLRVWVITGYEDARMVLTDPRVAKDLSKATPSFRSNMVAGGVAREVSPSAAKHLLSSDPPDHTRLRALVAGAFTPGRTRVMRRRLETVSAALLDGLAGRRQIELIGQYALPLSLTVICEWLGVPEADRHQVHRWTQRSSGSQQDVNEASWELAEFVENLLSEKRKNPGDDILTVLLDASSDSSRMSGDELVSMVGLLLSAGHDTVVNMIGNGVVALLASPDQLAALRADLSLIPAAVEELVRYESPVATAVMRFTTETISISGVEIPAGEFLIVSLASGNRDERRFEAAGELQIGRISRGHLGFGHGIHYCLGAQLARQEGEIAFRDILERFSGIELAVPVDELVYRQSIVMRGLEALPLRVTP